MRTWLLLLCLVTFASARYIERGNSGDDKYPQPVVEQNGYDMSNDSAPSPPQPLDDARTKKQKQAAKAKRLRLQQQKKKKAQQQLVRAQGNRTKTIVDTPVTIRVVDVTPEQAAAAIRAQTQGKARDAPASKRCGPSPPPTDGYRMRK